MNGKHIALLLALICAAAVLFNQQSTNLRVSEYEDWKAQFKIDYHSFYEDYYRQKIFLQNLDAINVHNSDQSKTYQLGLNQFSALTPEEYAERCLNLIVSPSTHYIESTDDLRVGQVDWVAAGAVTGVKDQGQCGSCWAFSATGSLEGLSKLTGSQVLGNFSEQQLVDCSEEYGNQGCEGGLMNSAFDYVVDYGIANQIDYPYKGVQQTCKTNTGSFKISGFVSITNCNDLASAVVGQPISVAVDATDWSAYKSGVFNNCKAYLNHGVLLVGITDQYWWIKNSWGNTWGEKGFIRLARGNTCGICSIASYPTA